MNPHMVAVHHDQRECVASAAMDLKTYAKILFALSSSLKSFSPAALGNDMRVIFGTAEESKPKTSCRQPKGRRGIEGGLIGVGPSVWTLSSIGKKADECNGRVEASKRGCQATLVVRGAGRTARSNIRDATQTTQAREDAMCELSIEQQVG